MYILRNAIKCNKCESIIKSEHTHDFKWCKCKSVAVDGGHEYLRRVGEPNDYTELSVVVEE